MSGWLAGIEVFPSHSGAVAEPGLPTLGPFATANGSGPCALLDALGEPDAPPPPPLEPQAVVVSARTTADAQSAANL
ncbi:hypothetical protein ABT297_12025 [Dactylosporangium sp. NPDC000555]|uniref:hypothetical protein n=1 Tax=Dactylosporangium sp. NPDC000555 TaxID=3154260 RepID=UPI003316C63B